MKESEKTIRININRTEYRIERRPYTGLELKQLAGINPSDTLFLEGRCEDEVVPNEGTIRPRKCDEFYSCPPAQYGEDTADLPESATILPQPTGWRFVVMDGFAVPGDYAPRAVRLLVKLPPTFPEGAPDMFWVQPQLRLASGGVPRQTRTEEIMGESWQRFSWHLQPGAWKPGISTLRDFLRAVADRLQRGD